MVIGGISEGGCSATLDRAIWKEATDGLEESGGVGMPPMVGVNVGVPRNEAVAFGRTIVGDWRGDCSSSVEWLRCSAIISGSSGVLESSWRSTGSPTGTGI